MTYKFRTYYYACNGPSCLDCEEYLPGFQTDHGGELILSEEDFEENKENILSAEANCPKSALTLDQIEE